VAARVLLQPSYFIGLKSNRTLLWLIGSTPLTHESRAAIRVDYRSTKWFFTHPTGSTFTPLHLFGFLIAMKVALVVRLSIIIRVTFSSL